MLEIILIALISAVPGYLLVSLLDRRLDFLERLALSLGVTFMLFGGLGLLLHSLGIPLTYTMLALIPMVGIVVWKRKDVDLPKIKVGRTLVIILVVAFLLRFVLQFFFAHPIVGDSYFHMDLARTFTTNDWFQVNAIDNLWSGVKFPFPEEYRPPFFNFVTGYFFNIFGTSFYIAKLVNVVIGVMAILPAYLIARRYGNERIALIVALFMAVNPLIINQSMEAEVRIITVYLALVSFYFFAKGREYWMYSGSFLGLLYLTHYAPATILVITYAAYFLLFARKEIFRKETLCLVLMFLLVVSPWLARNYVVFGDPTYTSSRYVTLMSQFNQILSLDKPTLQSYASYVTHDTRDFLFAKATNIYRSLFPLPVTGYKDGFLWNWDPSKNLNVLFNPISMVITLPVFALAALYIWRGLRRFGREKNLVVLYIAVGFLVSLVFWSYKTTFTYNFLFQQLVLMAIAGFVVLEKMKPKTRKILYVLIIASLLIQIPIYEIRANAKTDYAQGWISSHTNPDDVVMARWTNVHILNLLTDRKTVSMPFENESTVVDFARRNNVSYMVIDQLDLDSNMVSIGSLEKNLSLVETYRVPGAEGQREYTNTYWIFKV